jgi:drug/metabolite transporter (DMT)-like permease
MTIPNWVWIAIVLSAAAAQTVRSVAQRHLVPSIGILPATLVRFFYGLPFSVLALVVVAITSPVPLPDANAAYVGWIVLGAVAQLAATACLIAAMGHRSFVVVIAYSKTEILQVGIYGVVLLGESLSAATMGAIVISTIGVLALSLKPTSGRAFAPATWLSAGATLGLAAGALYALSGVGFRGAMLALNHPLPWVSGFYSVVWAQCIQTVLLGGYLLWRNPAGLARMKGQWRIATLAGLMGTLASMGWMTAYAIRSAVDVSIASLVDVIYSYALSRRFFKEPVSRAEIVGIVLIVVGLGVITAR